MTNLDDIIAAAQAMVKEAKIKAKNFQNNKKNKPALTANQLRVKIQDDRRKIKQDNKQLIEDENKLLKLEGGSDAIYKREMAELLKQINTQISADQSNFNMNVDTVQALINYYKISTSQTAKLQDLLIIKQTENKNFKKAFDEMSHATLTNDRKVIYEEQQRDFMDTLRFTLTIFYYLILVIYILFGDFVSNLRYKSVKTWFILILYVVFPFILNTIVIWTEWIYNKIVYILFNKAPRNVYTNL